MKVSGAGMVAVTVHVVQFHILTVDLEDLTSYYRVGKTKDFPFVVLR